MRLLQHLVTSSNYVSHAEVLSNVELIGATSLLACRQQHRVYVCERQDSTLQRLCSHAYVLSFEHNARQNAGLSRHVKVED